MRIVAIADLHELWDSIDLPSGDVLVIAGDLCEREDKSFVAAEKWLTENVDRFRECIYVPGNHDEAVLRDPQKYRKLAPTLVDALLVDKPIQIAGRRFYGMPWRSEETAERERLIPDGVDVLITHEPPHGIRDWSPRGINGLGSHALRRRVNQVQPRIHIFGHCHTGYGVHQTEATVFANVAICGRGNEYYGAAHPPTIIDVDGDVITVTQY